MNALKALETIKKVAQEIDQKFNCRPGQRIQHAKKLPEWKQAAMVFFDMEHKFALPLYLLESVDVYSEDGIIVSEYRITMQTVVQVIQHASIDNYIDSKEEIENYLWAMDYDYPDYCEIAKEVFDPRGCQLTGNSGISRDCLRGSYRQWYNYFLEMYMWYNDYCDEYRDNYDGDPPTIEDWAEEQIAENCSDWNGDLIFEPLYFSQEYTYPKEDTIESFDDKARETENETGLPMTGWLLKLKIWAEDIFFHTENYAQFKDAILSDLASLNKQPAFHAFELIGEDNERRARALYNALEKRYRNREGEDS